MLLRLITACVLLFSAAHATTWDEKAKEVDQWTDALGMPVDAGIKPLVIALNLEGIKTIASCEGHLDRALAWPWVDLDLETAQTAALAQEWIKIFKERTKEKFEAVREELMALNDKLNKAQAEAQQPLMQLLREYYKTNFVSYDRILVTTKFDRAEKSIYRLRNQGAEFEQLWSPEEKAEKLKEYQDEMHNFAQFLANRLANKQ